jgi:hypothetical protein
VSIHAGPSLSIPALLRIHEPFSTGNFAKRIRKSIAMKENHAKLRRTELKLFMGDTRKNQQ